MIWFSVVTIGLFPSVVEFAKQLSFLKDSSSPPNSETRLILFCVSPVGVPSATPQTDGVVPLFGFYLRCIPPSRMEWFM
jgi:hypothetical protein